MRRHSHRLPGQRGVGLVELMVGMTLGLVLVLVATSAYLQNAGSTRFATQQAQMNEDAAIALELLASQVRLAGYSSLGADGLRVFRGLALLGCDGGFTAATASADFDLLRCANNNATNDALAIRYEANAVNSPMVGDPLEPANCAGIGIAQSTVNGVPTHMADNRFYIAPDNTNAGTPTLYCRGSSGGVGMGNATALVPNVEALQLRLAVTRATAGSSTVPHQITAWLEPSDPLLSMPGGDWTRVAGVEICMVVRSDNPVAADGLTMDDLTRHLDCAGQIRTARDGRLRRAYRTTLWLPNLRPALPLPYEADPAGALFPYRHL